MWGRQDGLIAPLYAEEFRQRIAGSKVVLVDKATHVPHLEQLGEVGGQVQEFLGAD